MAAMSTAKVVQRAVMALVITAALAGMLIYGASPTAVLWLKSLHIMAVIAWMAGMFYLPRLFVYHTTVPVGSQASETFKVMERKLLRYIMNPAMVVSWAIGLWLAWNIYHFEGGWLWAKIVAVVALSTAHGYFAMGVRHFAEDRNTRSERHWRIVNEVPTLLMVAIVIFVVVKGF
ncbi:MAG: protoporphyrinogen oxidase HemJ [Methylacidiphilales bacterium]|nr:protoporphyrinogen oxidase HemJ [Candidatus Methylacidiphilales bacterium]